MTEPSDYESWSTDTEREITMETKEKKPLYLLQYTKQTSMLGEQVTITTNLPGESTEDEISAEVIKLGNVLDRRMRDMNETVKKLNKEINGKEIGFEEMGIDPGTIYVKEGE